MLKFFFFCQIILLLFFSCYAYQQSDIIQEIPDENTSQYEYGEMNDQVLNLMRQYYLWYENIPQEIPAYYQYQPQELLKEIRVPIDSWSRLYTLKEYQDHFEKGEYLGHGFQFAVKDREIIISAIYKESPLYHQGVRRGWKILAVDNVLIDNFFNAASQFDSQAFNLAMDTETSGKNEVLFKFLDKEKKVQELSNTEQEIKIDYVPSYTCFTGEAGETIAYLAYSGFMGPSVEELFEAFRYFSSQNASEMILDLRYNGGGYLDLSDLLANLIAPLYLENEVMLKLVCNDQTEFYNRTYYFIPSFNPDKISTSLLIFLINNHSGFSHINLNQSEEDIRAAYKETISTNPDLNPASFQVPVSRLFVITTENTASASEVIINCFRPYIDVHLIGERSYGKPVGMFGFSINQTNGNQWLLLPVSFSLKNAEDFDNYYTGFIPDYSCEDDYSHLLGSSQEKNIAAALHYINTGDFPESISSRSQNKSQAVLYADFPITQEAVLIPRK